MALRGALGRVDKREAVQEQGLDPTQARNGLAWDRVKDKDKDKGSPVPSGAERALDLVRTVDRADQWGKVQGRGGRPGKTDREALFIARRPAGSSTSRISRKDGRPDRLAFRRRSDEALRQVLGLAWAAEKGDALFVLKDLLPRNEGLVQVPGTDRARIRTPAQGLVTVQVEALDRNAVPMAPAHNAARVRTQVPQDLVIAQARVEQVPNVDPEGVEEALASNAARVRTQVLQDLVIALAGVLARNADPEGVEEALASNAAKGRKRVPLDDREDQDRREGEVAGPSEGPRRSSLGRGGSSGSTAEHASFARPHRSLNPSRI